MQTYMGIDYHKRYSYGVIMTEDRQILKQGRFANHPAAVAEFIGGDGGPECHAVLEATRNWTVASGSVDYDYYYNTAWQVLEIRKDQTANDANGFKQ